MAKFRSIFVIAAVLGLTGAAQADPFTGDAVFDFVYYDKVDNVSPTGTASFGSGVVSSSFSNSNSEYVVSGTGQVGPATGLNSFDTGLQFDFTNVSIECVNSSGCGFMGFEVRIGLTPNGFYAGDFPVFAFAAGSSTGSSPINIRAEAKYGAGSSSEYDALTAARNSTTVSGPGAFNTTLLDTTLLESNIGATPNNFSFVGSVSASSMAFGEVFTLPNSLTLLTNVAIDNTIPEPGTFVLLGGGLAGLLWMRRRKS